MGLIIILATTLMLYLTIHCKNKSYTAFTEKTRSVAGQWAISLVLYAIISVCGAILITILVTSVVYNNIDLTIVHTDKIELKELDNDVYVAAKIIEDTPVLVVKTEKGTQRLKWNSLSIQFDSETAYMEEHMLSFSNKTLRWLLLPPGVFEYTIYTPESNINNLYDLLTK